MFWSFVIDLAAAILLGMGWQTCEVEPKARMGELLNTTEDYPVIMDEWDRITDQPSHMVVDRVHGGITPGQGNLPVP